MKLASFEPQHFELEGQERDEAGAAKFAHKFLPDILFSAALASSREVVGFEQIESLKPQRPHVDIDMSLEKEAASKVIYFCSEVSDPNPRIATSVISSSRILQCFSKEEIEFLQQENFFMRPSQPEDEYFVKREPFAIIQGGSFIFDSLPMDVRDLVEPIQNPNNIDFKELMSRVRMVHGILMYYDRLPTFVINEDTKVLMRNAGDGPQDLRDNVLHSRYEDHGFVGEAGGLPSNQDPFEQPVVAKGTITRVIARIAFGKGQNNEFQVLK